jgi:hypothetical protein
MIREIEILRCKVGDSLYGLFYFINGTKRNYALIRVVLIDDKLSLSNIAKNTKFEMIDCMMDVIREFCYINQPTAIFATYTKMIDELEGFDEEVYDDLI